MAERVEFLRFAQASDVVIDQAIARGAHRRDWGGDLRALFHELEAARLRGKGRRTIALHTAIASVLERDSDAWSTRQVFYALVSTATVANSVSEYRRVCRAVVNMRREGAIPYSRIKDRRRVAKQRPSWDGLEDILEIAATNYRRDMWTDQPTIPIIALEKASLEGVVAAAADAFGVAVWTYGGFNSESFSFECAEEIRELVDRGKRIVIGYLGDHDPSGLEIERVERERLERFGVRCDWRRLGIFDDDIRRLNLPLIPAKKSDTRSKRFLIQFDRCAELDALPPDELRGRVRTFIEEFVDAAAWERVRLVEAAERESLAAVAKHPLAAIAAARAA